MFTSRFSVQNCVSSFNPESILIATRIFIFAYIFEYIYRERAMIRIREKIAKKSIKSCYFLLITVLKFDFSDQISLRWMHASDWNIVWRFRKSHSFWKVMLENEYAVFQARKYLMTLSLKINFKFITKAALSSSNMHTKLASFQASNIVCISSIFHKCLLDIGSKIIQRFHQDRAYLPLKGTSPIIPKMQDWSKMPFTMFLLAVSSSCQ